MGIGRWVKLDHVYKQLVTEEARIWHTASLSSVNQRKNTRVVMNRKKLALLGFILTGIQLAQIQAASGPDLIIDAGLLASSIRFETKKFTSRSCAVEEGCVLGPGKRKLLRFSVATPNIGDEDLVLGNPADHPELFTWSPCHGHYHFNGYANYDLLDRTGTVVLRGRKQAFCLLDSVKYDSTAGPAKFTCTYQGISAGWGDVYGSGLDCQWLDVTAFRGDYILRVTINPDGALAEDTSNNVAEVAVHIR